MSAEAGFEVVVGADGGIAPEELARQGVGPGAHLRVVTGVERAGIRPAYGLLRGQVPALALEDFDASRAAAKEAEASGSYPER
jgi:hypothetical protein